MEKASLGSALDGSLVVEESSTIEADRVLVGTDGALGGVGKRRNEMEKVFVSRNLTEMEIDEEENRTATKLKLKTLGDPALEVTKERQNIMKGQQIKKIFNVRIGDLVKHRKKII